MLLDKAKCLNNITRMAEKARRNRIRLRPHFKTHQSAQVGEWFRAQGVEAITVSSLRMAVYFAQHGWQDIMVAMPANIREIETINALARSIKLHLIAVNIETLQALARQLQHPVNIWIKIDTGYRRTGVLPHNYQDLDQLMAFIASQGRFVFQGFLSHDGHTYKQTDKEAIQTIHNTSVYLLQQLRRRYNSLFPQIQLSTGDTPSCSILEDLSGVDEIRPGNFVFYDLMQQRIGSCAYQDIAVCVACPVVALHPERQELIIYGGSVHFSKEAIMLEDSSLMYGEVVELHPEGWSAPLEEMEVVSLSQEHGVVRASDEQLRKYSVGDLIYILPVHSCLTADLMKGYLTLEGEWLEHLSGVPAQRQLLV